VTTIDIQGGGRNQHYGRIMHWLAGYVWEKHPDVSLRINVGNDYRDLSAVGDGLAQMGVSTPAAAARLCFDGQATFDRPRPALRSLGVVPHRDALVLGIADESPARSIDDIRERRLPVRISVPVETMLTGHASRHLLACTALLVRSLKAGVAAGSTPIRPRPPGRWWPRARPTP